MLRNTQRLIAMNKFSKDDQAVKDGTIFYVLEVKDDLMRLWGMELIWVPQHEYSHYNFSKERFTENDKQLLSDIISYGVYKSWGNASGDKQARAIMNDIHAGKYGSTQGIWPQARNAINKL